MLFTAKVVLRLRHALLVGDLAEAQLTLQAVRGRPVATVAMSEIRMAQDEVDNWILLQELTSALEAGRAGGTVGALVIDEVVATEGLDEAIKRAEERGVKTREAQALVLGAVQALKLRQALLAGDWDRVEAVVRESAGVAGLAALAVEELALASDELDNRRVVRLLEAALRTGGARGEPGELDLSAVDTTGLDEALTTGTDLGCKTERAEDL